MFDNLPALDLRIIMLHINLLDKYLKGNTCECLLCYWLTFQGKLLDKTDSFANKLGLGDVVHFDCHVYDKVSECHVGGKVCYVQTTKKQQNLHQ